MQGGGSLEPAKEDCEWLGAGDEDASFRCAVPLAGGAHVSDPALTVMVPPLATALAVVVFWLSVFSADAGAE